jgi:hypothetical protein
MESVEQQLQMSNSMNGYHIGHHLKANSNAAAAGVVQCPMELPEVQPLPNNPIPMSAAKVATSKPPPPPPPSMEKRNEDIASNYFQAKFGAGEPQLHVVQVQVQQNNHQQQKQDIRSQSVGFNGNRSSRSNTQTPDRDFRASSQAPVYQNGGRRPSFSYLSLLPADGSFPHRTNAIGNAQTSRRNSKTLGSTEQLNHFNKPNLMVRTNPIGLAEPSVKRDGYAVSKDGSFYRSSENLFHDSTKNGRAISATPDREMGSWRDQRRSSTSSVSSNSGIRIGGGLIETGRPVTQSFLPFGSTAKKGPNYVIKKGTRSRSQSKPPPPVQSSSAAAAASSTTNQLLTSSLSSSSSKQQQSSSMMQSSLSSTTTTNMTMNTQIQQSSSVTTSEERRISAGIAFTELDIALKKVAKEQEDSMAVEVTLPGKSGKGRRARSLSRNTTETLPDEVTTRLLYQAAGLTFGIN